MREETRLWLKQAEADLRTARLLKEQEVFYACVFFAQQAAEKGLKALWLQLKGDLPPKTHNLVTLARDLAAGDPIIEAAAELAPEYILTRYPTLEVAAPEDLYTAVSAQTHFDAAEAVLAWARQRMA